MSHVETGDNGKKGEKNEMPISWKKTSGETSEIFKFEVILRGRSQKCNLVDTTLVEGVIILRVIDGFG